VEESATRQVKTYSGGMRRRLDLAASLVVRAEVYFLDEPTTGLDPASRAQVHQLIRAIVAGGATVLLTTQYLEEADQLAVRLAVINHGRVIAEGTPDELKASPRSRPGSTAGNGERLGTGQARAFPCQGIARLAWLGHDRRMEMRAELVINALAEDAWVVVGERFGDIAEWASVITEGRPYCGP